MLQEILLDIHAEVVVVTVFAAAPEVLIEDEETLFEGALLLRFCGDEIFVGLDLGPEVH